MIFKQTDINQEYRSKFGSFRLFYYLKTKLFNLFSKTQKKEEEINNNMTATTILPEIEIVIKIPDVQLTENFKLSEFASRDGTSVPAKFFKNVKKVAENLQILRDYFNENKAEDEEEITITLINGFRSLFDNKRVRGAKFSQHKKAKAGDLGVKNRTPNEVHATIILLIKSKKMKQGGLGLYNTFVHYDTRGYRARWDERKRI